MSVCLCSWRSFIALLRPEIGFSEQSLPHYWFLKKCVNFLTVHQVRSLYLHRRVRDRHRRGAKNKCVTAKATTKCFARPRKPEKPHTLPDVNEFQQTYQEGNASLYGMYLEFAEGIGHRWAACGERGRDRTCNPELRRLVLYPIELRLRRKGNHCLALAAFVKCW